MISLKVSEISYYLMQKTNQICFKTKRKNIILVKLKFILCFEIFLFLLIFTIQFNTACSLGNGKEVSFFQLILLYKVWQPISNLKTNNSLETNFRLVMCVFLCNAIFFSLICICCTLRANTPSLSLSPPYLYSWYMNNSVPLSEVVSILSVWIGSLVRFA